MKGTTLIFYWIFYIVFPVVLFSQDRTFSGAILSGVSLSQLSGDDANGFFQPGIKLGGLIRLNEFKNDFYFSTGFFWHQKGARRFLSVSNTSDYNLRLNYIDLPFYFNYRLNDFIPFVGLSANFLFDSRELTSFGEQVDRPFRFFELSLNAGLNYRLSEKFSVYASYSNSITPIRAHDPNYLLPVPTAVWQEVHQFFLNKGQYISLLSIGLIFEL